MPNMTRKHVYLRGDQDRRVKSLAKRLRTSEGAVIREAVDEFLLHADQKHALARWRRHLRWVKERAERTPAAGRPREWTREELYDR